MRAALVQRPSGTHTTAVEIACMRLKQRAFACQTDGQARTAFKPCTLGSKPRHSSGHGASIAQLCSHSPHGGLARPHARAIEPGSRPPTNAKRFEDSARARKRPARITTIILDTVPECLLYFCRRTGIHVIHLSHRVRSFRNHPPQRENPGLQTGRSCRKSRRRSVKHGQ